MTNEQHLPVPDLRLVLEGYLQLSSQASRKLAGRSPL